MRVRVTASIDAGEILKKRGLEPGGRVQRMFTETCAREMDPYVPMSAGAGAHMKNRIEISGDSITYPGPYARYHYYGELMLAPGGSSWARRGERKLPTGRDMNYHGAPMRGKLWDERMWADKKTKIMRVMARATGGRPG